MRKNKAAVILKTGRFDNIDSVLMMLAESMLSNRLVLKITAALFFLLKLFSSHIYCINKNKYSSGISYTQGFHAVLISKICPYFDRVHLGKYHCPY